MLRLALDGAVLDSVDLPVISDWLRAHEIRVEWMPLTQVVEFEIGHIWYDEYRHYPSGSIVRMNDEPVIRREMHTCTLSCRGTIPGPLSDYRLGES